MVASALVRRERVPAKPPVFLPQLEALALYPHVEEISLDAGQVLLYEGHLAPGCFVFWSGVLLQQSVLFGEQREVMVGEVKQHEEEPGVGSALASQPLLQQVWVFPERVLLPVTLPFSVSTQSRTHGFFVPRSQAADPSVEALLHRFAWVP